MFAPSHAHAPWQINAFVRDHKSLEVEALYAQAPTRTRTYQMFRVCKPPLSSLLHFPAISNRSQKCQSLHGNSGTIAIPAIRGARSRLGFSGIFASRLSRWSSRAASGEVKLFCTAPPVVGAFILVLSDQLAPRADRTPLRSEALTP
jgi:hypothetical protein